MSERRHEIAQIELRFVRDTALSRRDRGGYHPWCRGTKHEGLGWPWWNVRFSYKTLSVRAANQSFYWCDVCLPDRYRTVADSMLRGKEHRHVLTGKALEKIVPRAPPQGADGHRPHPLAATAVRSFFHHKHKCPICQRTFGCGVRHKAAFQISGPAQNTRRFLSALCPNRSDETLHPWYPKRC